jgi:restriction endonuclease S subunit
MQSAPLRHVCFDLYSGLPPRARAQSDQDSNSSVPIVGVRTLTRDGTIDLGELESMEISGATPRSQSPLRRGDVLLTIRGSAVKCGFLTTDFAEPTYASGNLAVIRPDPERLDSSFLWAFLMRVARDEFHPLLTRATTQQLSIRITDLSKLSTPLPPLERQRAVGEAAVALRDAVAAARQAVATGERTFSSFLSEKVPS